MDEFTQLKKEKIYKTLSNLGEDISLTEWSDTQWYELRGYSTEEARQMVFEKYRAKLLNDDEITQHIVGYREAYIAFDEDDIFTWYELTSNNELPIQDDYVLKKYNKRQNKFFDQY